MCVCVSLSLCVLLLLGLTAKPPQRLQRKPSVPRRTGDSRLWAARQPARARNQHQSLPRCVARAFFFGSLARDGGQCTRPQSVSQSLLSACLSVSQQRSTGTNPLPVHVPVNASRYLPDLTLGPAKGCSSLVSGSEPNLGVLYLHTHERTNERPNERTNERTTSHFVPITKLS